MTFRLHAALTAGLLAAAPALAQDAQTPAPPAEPAVQTAPEQVPQPVVKSGCDMSRQVTS